ncbi:MAG: uncharacterized protein KVP18_004234 [Porospora cf. gigantea A]|uniref:uncharacterized protein n=1 Tax=Porospora cf. gigantea A TaxID=2853593 RepID=UPI003559B373|nr:MAG: hypothetical protein KVP18_004234 [Porospora cf. gigantea A]
MELDVKPSLMHYTSLNKTFFALQSEHVMRNRRRFGGATLGEQSDWSRTRLLDSPQVEIEMGTTALPPPWADTLGSVAADVKQVETKLATLQGTQNRRLMKIFDEGASVSEKEIETQSQAVVRLLKRLETGVFSITEGLATSSAREQIYRKNAQKRWAKELQGLSTQYRSAQKSYMDKIRLRTASPAVFESDAPTAHSGYESRLQTQQPVVERRTDEVARLTGTVKEVHQLFQDMACLVTEQGTVLDRVDANIDLVVDRAKQTNQQLKKAEENQRSGLAKKAIWYLGAADGLLVRPNLSIYTVLGLGRKAHCTAFSEESCEESRRICV